MFATMGSRLQNELPRNPFNVRTVVMEKAQPAKQHKPSIQGGVVGAMNTEYGTPTGILTSNTQSEN